MDRNENPTQQSITGARYDACLTRVDVSESVGVQLRDVWLVVLVTRRRVTVVSRTINQTRENQKEKPLTRLAQEEFSIRRQLEMT